MKRVFIAINLPEEVRSEFAGAQKKFPTLPCRWVKPENLHLTLAFLGNLNDQEILKALEAAKEAVSQTQSFSFSLSKVRYGPAKKMPPRLVWIEGEKSAELTELKKNKRKCSRRLCGQEIGFHPDKRDFTPHITLARIKTFNWQRLEPEQRPDIDLQINFEIPVNSIEVMESQLKRTGAEYKIIKSVIL